MTLPITSGDITIQQSDCPHARCLAGVFELCNLQNLPGVFTDTSGAAKSGSIIQIWADMRTVPPLPSVLITIDGLEEQEGEDDGFEVVGVVFPVNVLVVAREGWEYQNQLPQFLNWRFNLMEAFRNASRLNEVPECVDIHLRPRAILEPAIHEGQTYNLIVTSFAVECHCTMNRQKELLNP